ncbi:MAG: penicillin-binding protein [bacterium]|nr:MAG: penicillin-binding protein [bacterium]
MDKALKYKKFRIVLVAAVIMASFLASIGRLYYIQIIQHETYVGYSKSQYLQKVRLSPTRGKIMDRNLKPLAITVPMRSVFASPYKIEDGPAAARILSDELGLDETEVLNKLERKKNFVWIKRKILPSQFESLSQHEIAGISFLTEDKRFYPQKWLAARLIGFSGIDNQGLAGIEYHYDRALRGGSEIILAKKDALGRIYGFAGGRDPYRNLEMIITIDSNLQYIVEKVVRKGFEQYQAGSALAIIMGVKTGEILAIAEQPEFNPNDFQSYPMSRFRLLSVTESYEPGSTFKIFLAAAALDSGAVSPGDRFDCENGLYRIGGKRIREAGGRRFGELDFTEIITKSSNIGAIKIAGELGEKSFYGYIRRFGFGEKTGVDIPGEVSGFVRHYRDWSGLSLPSISFGQEINVTPIQMITALSAIGNGGMKVKPHLMKRIVQNGRTIEEYRPPAPRRIISEYAAGQTIKMMRAVVKNGTGRFSYDPGYDIVGKTGTAQKYDRTQRRYSKDRHIASFLALFPGDDPLLAIAVILDEPAGPASGGRMAGPMAKEIIIAAADYMGIPPITDTTYEVDWKSARRRRLPGTKKTDVGTAKEPTEFMEKIFAHNTKPDGSPL